MQHNDLYDEHHIKTIAKKGVLSIGKVDIGKIWECADCYPIVIVDADNINECHWSITSAIDYFENNYHLLLFNNMKKNRNVVVVVKQYNNSTICIVDAASLFAKQI